MRTASFKVHKFGRNVFLHLMKSISLLIWAKARNFRIPQLRLLFQVSQLSFPLLLNSGVFLWRSLWWWLPLKQIPWSSVFFKFSTTWRRWTDFGGEQLESAPVWSLKTPQQAAQETPVFSTGAERCSFSFSLESWKLLHHWWRFYSLFLEYTCRDKQRK